uniref:Uncharacterized protein n=1 Tax=Anguilla anguilla TaxID=7936 RepID=A0A0E9UP71_ANGAN
MCCLTLLVMFLKSLAVEKWFTQKQKEGKSSFVFSRSDGDPLYSLCLSLL